LQFSGYDPASAVATDGSGYVDLRCTCTGLDCLAFSYSIALDDGANSSGGQRRMKRTAGSEALDYDLYKDLTRISRWGAGSAALGGLYLLEQLGTAVRSTVFGRIPAGQVRPTGAYGDAIAVTVTY
jgi:spore coat protein U-like protein